MPPTRDVVRTLGWPVRAALIGLITLYRKWISPMFGPRCKYHPTCSAYGLQAVQEHGAAKGSALAGWRLLRCNPFSKGGFDPVPPVGQWLPDVYPDGKPRRPADVQQPTPETAPREA